MFIIVASSKELIPSQCNGKGLNILSMPQVIADWSVLAVKRAAKSKSSINRAASLSPFFSSPSRLGCKIQYEARSLPSVKNNCVRKIKNINSIIGLTALKKTLSLAVLKVKRGQRKKSEKSPYSCKIINPKCQNSEQHHGCNFCPGVKPVENGRPWHVTEDRFLHIFQLSPYNDPSGIFRSFQF